MRKIIPPLSIVFACVASVWAQNTVLFDNQSGEPAFVKLVGPSFAEIKVSNGAKRGVHASAGRYFIKVRYGMPGGYHYSKGEEFEVKETATTRAEIAITLHKVVSGNYESNPISEAEFNTERFPLAPSEKSDTVSVKVGDGAADNLKPWLPTVAVFTSKRMPVEDITEIKDASFGAFGVYAGESTAPSKEVLDVVSRVENFAKTAGIQFGGALLVTSKAIPSLFAQVSHLRLLFVPTDAQVEGRILNESGAVRVNLVDQRGNSLTRQAEKGNHSQIIAKPTTNLVKILAFTRERISYSAIPGVVQPSTVAPESNRIFLVVIVDAEKLGTYQIENVEDLKLSEGNGRRCVLRGVGVGVGESHVAYLRSGSFTFGQPPEQINMGSPGTLIMAWDLPKDFRGPIVLEYRSAKYAVDTVSFEEWKEVTGNDGKITAEAAVNLASGLAQLVVNEKRPAEVSDLSLVFSYNHIDAQPRLINPKDYPTLRGIPLENGDIVDFANVETVEFVRTDDLTGKKGTEFWVDARTTDGNLIHSKLGMKDPLRTSVSLRGRSEGHWFLKSLYDCGEKVRVAYPRGVSRPLRMTAPSVTLVNPRHGPATVQGENPRSANSRESCP